MIIYAGVLVGLRVLNVGYFIGNDDHEKLVNILIRQAVLTPIYGRIFGWW